MKFLFFTLPKIPINAEFNPKCWALLTILRMVLDKGHHVPDTHLSVKTDSISKTKTIDEQKP